MWQALQEQMMTSVHEISNLIEPVAIAAHSEASHLGHKVTPTPQRLIFINLSLFLFIYSGKAIKST
jgi:hypothetical protein